MLRYLALVFAALSITPSALTADELNRSPREIAEDIANSQTADDAAFLFANLAGALRTELDHVRSGYTTMDRFAGIVGQAGSVLGGEALVLGRVEQMISADTVALQGLHVYENKKTPQPAPSQQLIELENAEVAMGEYARVQDIAQSKIDHIDAELAEFAIEKQRITGLVDQAAKAEAAGVDLEKMFRDLNSEGYSIVIGTDRVWLDLSAVINNKLSERQNAASAAAKRLDQRIEYLGTERHRFAQTRDWMRAAWWYELLRDGLQEPSAGLNALYRAKKTSQSTLDDMTVALRTAVIAQRIDGEETRNAVAGLLRDAARADKEAARHSNMMKILNVGQTGLSAGADIAAAASPSAATGGQETGGAGTAAPAPTQRKNPNKADPATTPQPQNQLEKDGAKMLMTSNGPDLLSLPEHLQPYSGFWEKRFRWSGG